MAVLQATQANNELIAAQLRQKAQIEAEQRMQNQRLAAQATQQILGEAFDIGKMYMGAGLQEQRDLRLDTLATARMKAEGDQWVTNQQKATDYRIRKTFESGLEQEFGVPYEQFTKEAVELFPADLGYTPGQAVNGYRDLLRQGKAEQDMQQKLDLGAKMANEQDKKQLAEIDALDQEIDTNPRYAKDKDQWKALTNYRRQHVFLGSADRYGRSRGTAQMPGQQTTPTFHTDPESGARLFESSPGHFTQVRPESTGGAGKHVATPFGQMGAGGGGAPGGAAGQPQQATKSKFIEWYASEKFDYTKTRDALVAAGISPIIGDAAKGEPIRPNPAYGAAFQATMQAEVDAAWNVHSATVQAETQAATAAQMNQQAMQEAQNKFLRQSDAYHRATGPVAPPPGFKGPSGMDEITIQSVLPQAPSTQSAIQQQGGEIIKERAKSQAQASPQAVATITAIAQTTGPKAQEARDWLKQHGYPVPPTAKEKAEAAFDPSMVGAN